MDESINSLNVEVGVFLHNLRCFMKQQNMQLGNKTMEMLMNTLACIDEIVNKASVAENANETSLNFLEEMNEQHFELRRNIVCRLCIESFSISKEDFDTHSHKPIHGSRLGQSYDSRVHNQATIQSVQPAKAQKSAVHKTHSQLTPKDDLCFENTESTIRNENLPVHFSQQSFNVTKVNTQQSSFYGPANPTPRNVDNTDSSEDFFVARERNTNVLPSRGIEPFHSLENLPKLDEAEQNKIKRDLSAQESARKREYRSERAFMFAGYQSESSGSESSEQNFNFDSKYLIELRGLPWSATRQDIVEFLKDISILNGVRGIHFISDEKSVKSGRAYIQLEQVKDFTSAKRLHNHSMGDRYIEVLMPNISHFKAMVSNQQIPCKDRVIFITGIPKQQPAIDIKHLFFGLPIERFKIVSPSKAFVKFRVLDDVELAIKRCDKKSSIRIYRSTEKAMLSYQDDSESSCSSSHRPGNLSKMGPNAGGINQSTVHVMPHQDESTSYSRSATSHISKMPKTEHVEKYMKIRGIPWGVRKDYIHGLFPALEIDKKDGVQFEADKRQKNRHTGTAFVAFQNVDDFEVALKTNLTFINQRLKAHKATKAEFMMTKESNDATRHFD